MAARLVDAPRGLVVFDVDPAACADCEQAGATRADSPRQLAEMCDVVSVMVRDDAQVRAVFTGPDGLLAGAAPGCVLVIHSTIHPSTAVELAELAAPGGVSVLDAPVSGGPGGAKEGRLAIMVGGDPDAFERARVVLDRMGDLVVHIGPVGYGTRAKLTRNAVHFISFAATTEAQRLAEAAGVDLQLLGRIVRHTDAITGGPGSIMWRDRTGPLDPEDSWYPIFDNVRKLGEKDLTLAIELAEQLGVDTPLARMALGVLGPGLGIASGERTDG
jgi:3-hydroxyisobutyrate dehydrogenase